MPVYTITHGTLYRYSQPVVMSHQVLHLEPLATETQECLNFSLDVQPQPLEIFARKDYFGNQVHHLTITEPHQELQITARSQVAVTPFAPRSSTLTCGEARAWLDASTEAAAHHARQFLYPSAAVPNLTMAKEWAERIFPDGRSVLEGVSELAAEIHHRFTFDPSATLPSTPLEEFIQLERGVCQDFAHLSVAILRAAGLAGRYVSGYLLTNPPPGQPRRIGADASHAWAGAYVPGSGWVDFDPTNNSFCDEQHITTARGREYGDISPVRGTVVGGGPQALFLGVTVIPAGEQSQSQSQ